MMNQLRPFSTESFWEASKGVQLKHLIGYYPWLFNRSYDHHVKAMELRDWIPKRIFSDYYKFTFVRNPWDWHVSLYHFVLQYKHHHEHELYKSLGSFDRYVEWRVNEHPIFLKSFVCNEQDELLVDFVGKFENLEQDFKQVANNLQLPQLELPHLKPSKHKDFRNYYSNRTRQLIYDCHRQDIALFDYESIWD